MVAQIQKKLSEQALLRYIDFYVDALGNKEKSIGFSAALNLNVGPGVYSVFDGKTIIYVGESGLLSKRIRDLRITQNHSLRVRLGEKLYSKYKSYAPASSKVPFPPDIEIKLTKYFENNISIVLVPTTACRKEIEEHAFKKYKATLLNKRGKRA